MAYIMVICSAPSDDAPKIVSALLNARLIACGTALPGTSWFYWKGVVQRQEETLLVMKSRSDKWDFIQERISSLHPYDIPEIIAVPIEFGISAYMAWIDEVLDNEP
jgi:periplasmic divalent cation tolerance protein